MSTLSSAKRRDGDVCLQGNPDVKQPVFIAMELAICDFGELRRHDLLSRSALCEGFLLTFVALNAVHRSGALHRDITRLPLRH